MSQQKRGSAGTASQGRVKPDDVDEEVEISEGDDSVRADGNAQITDGVSSLGPERELLTAGCGYRYEFPFSGPR